jgi:hypothetical protein
MKLGYVSGGKSDGTYTLTKLSLDAGDAGVYALAQAVGSLQSKTIGTIVKSKLTELQE